METRDRIVTAARDLFWRRGYHATSIAEVLDTAEAGSGSLYHFFPSKEALLMGVLEHYLDRLAPEVVEPAFARSADPIERIFHLLDGYRAGLASAEFEFACPIGRLALEAGDLSEPVRELIDANFREWCRVVESCLEAAGDSLPSDLDSRALARFVLTTMEGALMQSRVARSFEPFDASITHLRAYLDGLLSAPGRAA